jgi:hypothetical protein
MIEHSEALDGRMNAPRVPHGASLKVTTIFVIHCRVEMLGSHSQMRAAAMNSRLPRR